MHRNSTKLIVIVEHKVRRFGECGNIIVDKLIDSDL